MGCPSRRDGHPYTVSQREHLLGLLAMGAVSRETGRNIFAPEIKAHFRQGLNPLVVGALRNRGLAESRSVRPRGGSATTEYWLTDKGRREAEALRDADAAIDGRSASHV
jgi:hypothetical protein